MTRIAVVAAAVGLAACISVPERSAADLGIEIPEPPTSTGDIEEVSTAAWRAVVEDARLERLVREAFEGNRDLAVFAARVDAADARARIAGADRLPQVTGSLNASRQRQNFIGFPIPGASSNVLSTTSERASFTVEVSWEADLWGRLRARREGARADAGAVAEDLEAARLALAARVARAYWTATETALQLRLARDTVASYETSRDSLRRRYDAGLSPALDLRFQNAQLAEARALAALRRTQLEQSTRVLEVLLGRYPSGELAPADSLPDVVAPLPAGVPADLIAHRPDLRAAERRLFAADARLVEARASLYPSLRLTASGGSVSEQFRDLLDGDFRVWSLLGGLAQPIFQGGRLRASVDVADAGVREALAGFANHALTAYAEVETALAIDAELAVREGALAEADHEAGAARRISEEQYRQGISDVLVLLESRRRQFLARGQLLAVRRARLDNRIDLALALGGAVDAQRGNPARAHDPHSEGHRSDPS